ncbi:hypothetical protein A33M_2202 [Rhodovulum sp. PH10]|nr:hypothetical protein A33M_2202 [Rhodovulum sp. PH10]
MTSSFSSSHSSSRSLPGTPQRARRMTDAEINAAIDRKIERNVLFYADHLDEIPQRLRELDAEWDLERALQANAATITVLGSLLTLTRGARYMLLPAVVGGFLLQHATQGWCPPLPIMRRLGFRTSREIEVERNALKALRGDYGDVPKDGEASARARAALKAAQMDSVGHSPGAIRSTVSPPTVPHPV